ncbi:DUF2207 domain-containing protein [Microbaculum marinum]|uniref:DUF2207 domain-containing protein n=1 Tax=Microbaculum marinum TaxID=1764581 RepID=A0AAW9RVV3_9HYPH
MRILVSALLVLAAALLPTALASPAHAQDTLTREVIRTYDVRIAVQQDGAVLVTEDIEVVALGREIRRGIYRDIPVGGVGLLGIGRPSFDLVQTLRDGRPEPSRIERSGGAVRIYLGDAGVFLEPGVYRYRIVYRMGDQVRRFDGVDEVYWNVTGNNWAFPIEQATAVVVPPPGAPVSQLAAYTGYRGEQGEDVVIGEARNGDPQFRTTRTLASGEGLTVAVGWPPGYVDPESGSQRLARWIERWGALAAAALTLGIVLIYYLVVWFLIGRDPPRGTIIPVYHPEMPPAAMRSVERMGFDYTCVAAAIISLAVKGHLKIREASKKQTLVALPDADARQPMSDGEAVLYDELFDTGEEIVIQRTSRSRLTAASNALRNHLRRTYDRIYFKRNFGWFVLGVVVTIFGWFASALISVRHVELLFLAIFPTVFAVVLGTVFVKAWRSVRDYRRSSSIVALVASIIQVGVIGFMVLSLGGFFIGIGTQMGLVPFLTLIVIALLNVVFWNLLKVRTAIGRKAMDEIEGTRLYLTVAEEDRLRFENPPDKTPEHFHEMLPYAIALDVETEWTDQFAAEIAAAHAAQGSDPYLKPSWYSGSRGSGFRDAGALRSVGASLGSAYGAATVTQSSGSSGSSGGGSSGGGGGGGGGGGW